VKAKAITHIKNYLTISETLGTGGQPDAEELAALKAEGYATIINLDVGTSQRSLQGEDHIVAQQGIDYVHIPVVWERPTLEDLERFFAAMDARQEQKIFVHCVLNMRVSCFVYLYRVIKQGVPEPQARKAMRKIWEPNATWQAFIEEALAAYDVQI
jgi:protein tyrosine phosphatase (PTP) superfamily phosphohydrolase (DUF442 family)